MCMTKVVMGVDESEVCVCVFGGVCVCVGGYVCLCVLSAGCKYAIPECEISFFLSGLKTLLRTSTRGT